MSTAIGVDPAWFYVSYLDRALWPAPVVLFLVVVAAIIRIIENLGQLV